MRVLLVANAKSGTSTDPDEIVAALEAHGARPRLVDIHDVEDVAPDGAQRVVVAGGDGSIGLAARLAANHGLPLGVVPTGTANDFARAMSLPLDTDAAAALAADPNAPTRRVEIACNDDRPFLNAASTGLSVQAAEAARPHKPRLGPLAYALGAGKAAVGADPIEARVEIDDATVFEGPAWQVIVAATGHFGGGSSIGGTHHADGELDVAVVPAGSRLALAKRAFAMKRGKLVEQDDVPHHRGRTVAVHGARTFNVDGEVCDCGAPATFTVTGHVDVVVP